jgi:DNA-directed RNA polymerase specialized sigma subunit
LANHVKYKCLTNITKQKWSVSLDDENNSQITSKLTENKDDFSEKRDFIFNLLSQMKDKRLEKIIAMRYYGDKNSRKWKNISKELGITYQTAITLHKKALDFLKTKIQSKSMQDFV